MNKYLITGLPRSRTAWMASFMPNCIHEPIVDMTSIEDLETIYLMYDGISDSSLGFWLGWILKNLKIPTLIIDRPIHEVEASLKRLNTGLPDTNYVELLHNHLVPFYNHPLVKVITFADMHSKDKMREAFTHLCPNEVFDEVRFESMKNTIITVEPDLTQQVHMMNELMPYIRIRG